MKEILTKPSWATIPSNKCIRFEKYSTSCHLATYTKILKIRAYHKNMAIKANTPKLKRNFVLKVKTCENPKKNEIRLISKHKRNTTKLNTKQIKERIKELTKTQQNKIKRKKYKTLSD